MIEPWEILFDRALAQLDAIERSGKFEKRLREYTILPGGEKVRGKELELCKEFIKSAEQTLNLAFGAQSQTGAGGNAPA